MTVQRARLIKTAAVASLATALILLAAKIFAWVLSDSASVLSSLLDSLMDIAASAVNFYAVRYALVPADRDHPFGHTKAEGIAALIQSAFILGSAVVLLLHVMERLLNPQPVMALEESIGVMLFSALATAALVLYQRYVYRQTGSLAIKADSAHYYGDILTSLAVVAALLAAYWEQYWLDPVVALLIALVLLSSVLGIVKSALAVLMDQAMAAEDLARLQQTVLSCSGVRGCHDVLTRQSGPVQFIQLHLELDGQQSLYDAHAIGRRVELAIRAEFPHAQIIIHQDPV